MAIYTRIVFNERHWIFPSGHPWTTANQKDPNNLYQHRFGFGYEEWLFNARYITGGYQYGFLQGLQNYRSPAAAGQTAAEPIDRVYLYSIRHTPHGDQSLYIGYINDVEPLGPDWRTEQPDAAQLFDQYTPQVTEEVKAAGGDISALDSQTLYPNVRFNIDNVFTPFDPVPIDFPLESYPAFKAYPITGRTLDLFTDAHGGPGGR